MKCSMAVSVDNGKIDANGEVLEVEFLRVGRLTYVYLTLDGKSGAYWNKLERKWEVLPDEFLDSVNTAVKFSRGISQPVLFKVPVPVAEAAQ